MGETAPNCYIPPRGQAFDYRLWPKHQANCKKKKSCAPPIHPVLPNKEAIKDFSQKINSSTNPNRLPQDPKQLEKIFFDSSFYVGEDASARLLGIIKEFIDNAGENNVYILVGVEHPKLGHNGFFNRILSKGNGFTHLVLEWERISCGGKDLQLKMDRFLLSGKNPVKTDLEGNKGIGAMPLTEVKETDRAPLIGRQKCLNVVEADAPCKDEKRYQDKRFGLPLRDKFAVESVLQRQFPDRKNVMIWKCGAAHAEKRHLPAAIKEIDPDAKVLSIVLNGGEYDSTIYFDRMTEALGLRGTNFLVDLRTKEYLDADIIYHLPAGQNSRYSNGPVPVYRFIEMPQ